MEKRMKGISIIRVSTEEQKKEGKAGIERQQYAIEQIIKRYNIDCIKSFEVQVSGSLFYNTEEAEEIDMLLGSQVSCVIVSSIDRFTRATDVNSLLLMQKLIDKRVMLITSERIYDLTKPIDFFEGMLHSLVGGLERNSIQTRMQGGKEELRKKGFHVCGQKQLPYGVGYRAEMKDGKKIPVFFYKEEYIPKIKMMFDMIEQGIPYEQISKKLDIKRNNIPVIAMNKVWIGYREYRLERTGERIFTSRKKWYKKKCERKSPLIVKIIEKPLLSEERFKRICLIIEERRKTRLISRSRAENFLYTSILKCAECENPLYAKSKMNKVQIIKKGKNAGKVLRHNLDYYTCSSYCLTYRQRKEHQGVNVTKCGSHWQEKIKLESIVDKFISTKMTKPDFFKNVTLHNKTEVIDDSKLATGIELEIQMLTKREEETYTNYRKGVINVDRFNVVLDGYQKDRKELEARKKEILSNLKKEDKRIPVKDYFLGMAQVFAEYEFLNTDEKKELSRNMFKAIYTKSLAITGFAVYEKEPNTLFGIRSSASVGNPRGAASGLRVHFC